MYLELGFVSANKTLQKYLVVGFPGFKQERGISWLKV